jgi:hypothetical protein
MRRQDASGEVSMADRHVRAPASIRAARSLALSTIRAAAASRRPFLPISLVSVVRGAAMLRPYVANQFCHIAGRLAGSGDGFGCHLHASREGRYEDLFRPAVPGRHAHRCAAGTKLLDPAADSSGREHRAHRGAPALANRKLPLHLVFDPAGERHELHESRIRPRVRSYHAGVAAGRSGHPDHRRSESGRTHDAGSRARAGASRLAHGGCEHYKRRSFNPLPGQRHVSRSSTVDQFAGTQTGGCCSSSPRQLTFAPCSAGGLHGG